MNETTIIRVSPSTSRDRGMVDIRITDDSGDPITITMQQHDLFNVVYDSGEKVRLRAIQTGLILMGVEHDGKTITKVKL